MVDQKKPAAKPALTATDGKSTTPISAVRPSLPSLSPIPEIKHVGAKVQAAAPAAVPAPSEKTTQPASTERQPTATPVSASKPVEKLGPKLRKRDDILKALRAGSKVMKVDGLLRIVNTDGSKNATSKRRILSLESQKLLIASADGNSYTLNLETDKKAQEPKPVATAEARHRGEKVRFPLGRIVATPGALAAMEKRLEKLRPLFLIVMRLGIGAMSAPRTGTKTNSAWSMASDFSRSTRSVPALASG